MKSIDDEQRRAGHAQVEVAGDRQVAGELGVFQVAHPRRADACLGQSVVQPGGRAVAQVGAQCLVNRREDLEQDEDDAHESKPLSEALAALDTGNQHSHGDGEDCGQHASKHQHNPPQDSLRCGCFRQHSEELPLVPCAQTLQHGQPSSTAGDENIARQWARGYHATVAEQKPSRPTSNGVQHAISL